MKEAIELAGEHDFYVTSEGTSVGKDGRSNSTNKELRERKLVPGPVFTQVLRTGDAVITGRLDGGQSQGYLASCMYLNIEEALIRDRNLQQSRDKTVEAGNVKEPPVAKEANANKWHERLQDQVNGWQKRNDNWQNEQENALTERHNQKREELLLEQAKEAIDDLTAALADRGRDGYVGTLSRSSAQAA